MCMAGHSKLSMGTGHSNGCVTLAVQIRGVGHTYFLPSAPVFPNYCNIYTRGLMIYAGRRP